MSLLHKLKFPFYAGGIFFIYFYYGILHEKITRTKYGEQNEIFTFSLALVYIQCVVNAIYAKIMLKVTAPQGHDTTKRSYYAICSLTYLLAMVCSNKALQWVNYPTQVVGKSCKPIPVMVLGVLLGRKSYPWRKYIFIIMIVLGVSIFMYRDGKKSSELDSSSFGLGELMLLISLTMDGLTGAVQERMIAESKTKSGHMMLNMNIWSICYLVIVVTTTRKFFTVLGSVILFGNTLISRQWLGAILVFAGLLLDASYGKTKKKEPKDVIK